MLFVCGWSLSNHAAHTGNAWRVRVSKLLLPLDTFLPFMLKCHWNNKGGVPRSCVFKNLLLATEQRKMYFGAVLPSFHSVLRYLCVVCIVANANNCKTVFFSSRNCIWIGWETATEPKHQFCQGTLSNFETSVVNLSFIFVRPRLNLEVSLESGDESNLKSICQC